MGQTVILTGVAAVDGLCHFTQLALLRKVRQENTLNANV